jgi:CO/xanthine dehydrogenase Mo-binding subunit
MSPFLVSRSGSGDDAEIEVTETSEVRTWPVESTLAIVGTRQSRLEGREKVTGSARYTYDVRLPRQLYARVMRSPHPHAHIARLDTSAAERLPGVHAVISANNAGSISWYGQSWLFDATLRFVGDEVAAVAADSEEIAEDALRLIEIEYEALPHVTDLDGAIAPDAPRIWPDGNIVEEPKIYDRGDADAALAAADVVIDETFETASALHNSLEPHGATAWWDGDTLTLYDSTQSIFTVREEVAAALDLPAHKVRVIKEHMGGGFGAKQVAWKQDVIAALLSREAGRPVQLMLDREAENLAVGNRPSTRQRVRLGATRDGTLTAIHAEIHQARGAYLTGGEASNVSGMYQTLYRCGNVHTSETQVYINAGPAVAFRAPGHVESAFALEQGMDMLARKLDMDPVSLRRRNYAETDQLEKKPYSLPEGLRLCYDKVTEAIGWERYRKPELTGTKRRGIGFAAHDWIGGSGHPPGYAWIELNSDGTVDIVTGTQDIGTGTRTGLTQVAAEELGLPIDDVAFHLGDTSTGPYAPVSSGSATQATIGPALRTAALEVKRQLLEVAANVLEASVEDLEVREGEIYVADTPDRGTPIREIMQEIAPHTIHGRGARDPNLDDVAVRTFGAQFIEVEVDTATGELIVLRVVTAHDIGRIINPAIVDNQVIGGITQGLGFGYLEGRVIDDRLGLVLNPNLEDYKIPTIADVPPIDHILVDVADTKANSTGAKGVGEPPLIPTAPALSNAIFDAVGVRVRTSPINRQRLLNALARLGDNA